MVDSFVMHTTLATSSGKHSAMSYAPKPARSLSYAMAPRSELSTSPSRAA